ncbi:MAG: hypothetical protein HY744_10225 [Deltaproteobacteria bacterium]|nr:hypothetical protein [Deltaproteobacteria bacterium]
MDHDKSLEPTPTEDLDALLPGAHDVGRALARDGVEDQQAIVQRVHQDPRALAAVEEARAAAEAAGVVVLRPAQPSERKEALVACPARAGHNTLPDLPAVQLRQPAHPSAAAHPGPKPAPSTGDPAPSSSDIVCDALVALEPGPTNRRLPTLPMIRTPARAQGLGTDRSLPLVGLGRLRGARFSLWLAALGLVGLAALGLLALRSSFRAEPAGRAPAAPTLGHTLSPPSSTAASGREPEASGAEPPESSAAAADARSAPAPEAAASQKRVEPASPPRGPSTTAVSRDKAAPGTASALSSSRAPEPFVTARPRASGSAPPAGSALPAGSGPVPMFERKPKP